MKETLQIIRCITACFGTLSVLILLSGSATGDEVDDIINKHIEAHGGAESWSRITSIKTTGQFTGFSIAKEFTTIKANPDLYYSEYHLGKYKITEASGPDGSWTIDPWQELDFPRSTNRTETNVLLQKADFCTPFFSYKEKGSQVEYLGKDTLEGTIVEVLKLTRANKMEETWYLDAKTGLEYKYNSQWADFAWPSEAETYFDDFREVDGIVLPFYIDRSFGTRNRVTEIEKVEINAEFDKEIFSIPRSKEIQRIGFIEGEWDVSIDVMTRRGTWYRIDSTVSKIEYAGINLFVERIAYERVFPLSKVFNYTFSKSSGKYRISEFSSLFSSLDMFEGEFREDTLFLDDLHISYGDTSETERSFTQYVLRKTSDDAFTIERNTSSDKGKTWSPRDRLSYIRKPDL